MVRQSNSRDRFRRAAGSSVISPPSHYGSCDLAHGTSEGAERNDIDYSRCFSFSSSEDDSDDNEDEENAFADKDLEPLPSLALSSGREHISIPHEPRRDFGSLASIVENRRCESRQEAKLKESNNQSVSFLEASYSLFPTTDQASYATLPAGGDNTTTEAVSIKPALSANFQDSWRRKSCRRISALISALPQDQRPHQINKKSAKDRWAILREHVMSGRFFLDQSMASYGEHCRKAGTPRENTRQSQIHKRHSSIARSLKREIQSGLEFSLPQCIGAIAIYLMLSVICFSFLMEGTRDTWTVIDSMYFAVATFTTIGFGDLTPPDTTVAHLVVSVYSLSGVACLGMALGVIGHRLVDMEANAVDKAQHDVMALFSSSATTTIHDPECGELPEDVFLVEELHSPNRVRHKQSTHISIPVRMWDATLGKVSSIVSRHASLQPIIPSSSDTTAITNNSSGRRKVLHQTKRPPHPSWKNINKHFLIVFGFIFLFSYLIGDDAGWNFTQTLYFAITTSCTIGYGDKVPTSQTGRLLMVFLIPFAVGAMGFILQGVAETMLHAKQWRHMDGIRRRELTVMDLEAMDSDGDGNVDWSEYLEFMLVAMKKVDEDLLWELRYQFDELDVDDTGVLSKQNLICMARQRLQQTPHKLHLKQYKQYLLKKGCSATTLDLDMGTPCGHCDASSIFC